MLQGFFAITILFIYMVRQTESVRAELRLIMLLIAYIHPTYQIGIFVSKKDDIVPYIFVYNTCLGTYCLFDDTCMI